MVLRKGVCSLFIPLKLRSAVHVEPTKLWEPWHILWERMELGRSKVSTKVRGFAFGSISLHLISKRIKEILTQKHQYNAKYLSRFNDKDAFRKLKKTLYCFQISAVCIGVCAYMHTTFLVGEIPDRFLGQALCGFVADKQPPKRIFCLLLKETWICFSHIICQLLHGRPVLCLNISTPPPLTFCAFSKLNPPPPQIKPLRKLYPTLRPPSSLPGP